MEKLTITNEINGEQYTLDRVNANTQKASALNYNYENSDFDDTELYNVYGYFSARKAGAFEYCKRLRYALNGTNGHITSHNSQFFCYAFEFVNPNDGVIEIAYITPYNNYFTDKTEF